jgi:hypothetical protein
MATLQQLTGLTAGTAGTSLGSGYSGRSLDSRSLDSLLDSLDGPTLQALALLPHGGLPASQAHNVRRCPVVPASALLCVCPSLACADRP